MAAPATSLSAGTRGRLLLLGAVIVIAVAVWGVGQLQRNTADRAFTDSQAGQRMITGMLDQETSLRGYALTRIDGFLGPFRKGVAEFDSASASASASASTGRQRMLVRRQRRIALQWRRLAREELVELRRDKKRPLDPRLAVVRKRVFDRFRRANASFQADVAAGRDRDLNRAGLASVAVIVALCALFGGVGSYLLRRDAQARRAREDRDRSYRHTQAEFGETMQIMRDQSEAHALVKHHLERALPDVAVTVLNRNNSDNRLIAATAVDPESPLAQRLTGATPDSCLAVRLGRAYEGGASVDPLLTCDLCGSTAAEVSCVPSLVSGEVIGSVLLQSRRPLQPEERDRVTESVAQSAPVLANLRSLAIAETRAATDALTGLPNARACHDTLKRMVAHAGRTLSPVSAVMLDLDHFKQINDRFGHGAGDDALAATGSVLRSAMRASDFAGRYGGEEFLILLPDTDQDGALELAEKLRRAIGGIEIPAIEREITASLGVATYPVDALDGNTLMRSADRALYAAKAAGRDRVELAVAAPAPEPADA